jgi:hypothetical protein
VNEITCAQCGATGLEAGFIEDTGSSLGYQEWIAGPLELNRLGNAKRRGRRRRRINAHRCPDCGHLELFAV